MRGKKFISILAVLFIGLLCSNEALADVIWEPQDDFYEQHYEDCDYINRKFTVNGPNGSAVLYKSPENDKKVDTLENGTAIYISFVYTDKNGREWGVYENTEENTTGWIPMAYTEVVYDYISFDEEYGSQFLEKSGALDSSYMEQEIQFWNYPGSTDRVTISLKNELEYATVFVDEDGREWGYIGYFYGIKNKWVCIDNPTADFDTLYPETAPERGNSNNNDDSGQNDLDIIVPDTSEKNNMAKTVIIIVGGVVIVTGILLVCLRKSKK